MKFPIACLVALLPFTSKIYAQEEKKGSLNIQAEPGIEALQKAYIEQSQAQKRLTGYRVQIYNGRNAESLNMRAEFVSKFPDIPVYRLYEAPEYKVQAGDFRTRLEAEKFLREVIANFGSGFVVKTHIQYPPLKSGS